MFQLFTSSRTLSEPIHLYEVTFGIGATGKLRLTDAETDIVAGGETFQNCQISHGNITASGTLDKASVDITTPRNNPMVELFRSYPPDSTVTVVIYRGERNDPDAEFKQLWGGRILNFSIAVNEAKFTCDPAGTSIRRPGLRRTYQYGCPHVLYGSQCKASKAAASSNSTVQAVTGSVITLPPGWNALAPQAKYIKGMLEWTGSRGQPISRTILQLLSTSPGGPRDLLLAGIPTDLYVGATVSVVLGCAHGMDDCGNLHHNLPNYGGCPWITKVNPLGQGNNFY